MQSFPPEWRDAGTINLLGGTSVTSGKLYHNYCSCMFPNRNKTPFSENSECCRKVLSTATLEGLPWEPLVLKTPCLWRCWGASAFFDARAMSAIGLNSRTTLEMLLFKCKWLDQIIMLPYEQVAMSQCNIRWPRLRKGERARKKSNNCWKHPVSYDDDDDNNNNNNYYCCCCCCCSSSSSSYYYYYYSYSYSSYSSSYSSSSSCCCCSPQDGPT